MKKFLALYMAPTASLDEMMKSSTPEEMKKSMEDWNAWAKRHKKELADLGNPAGKNKRVTESGVADVRNEICGYSIVTAASHEAAADLFVDNPHFTIPGGYIEVLELLDMPGE